MEIKLKKEEEDRQLRRKRVEAIMLRTRNQGKGSGNALIKVCHSYVMRVYSVILLIINFTSFFFSFSRKRLNLPSRKPVRKQKNHRLTR